jgi:hypothetical protein
MALGIGQADVGLDLGPTEQKVYDQMMLASKCHFWHSEGLFPSKMSFLR